MTKSIMAIDYPTLTYVVNELTDILVDASYPYMIERFCGTSGRWQEFARTRDKHEATLVEAAIRDAAIKNAIINPTAPPVDFRIRYVHWKRTEEKAGTTILNRSSDEL